MKPFIAVLAVALAVVAAQRGGRRQGRQQASSGYGVPDEQPQYGSGASLATAASEVSEDHQGLDWLLKSVPGVPGEDYPILAEVPETSFGCDGQVEGGYYADTETECQAFHVCTADGLGGLSKYSFLCPNGTIFNQEYFICDWWFNFDCSQAEGLYSKNEEVAAEREAASQGSGNLASASSNTQSQYAEPAQDTYGSSRQGRRNGK